MENKMNTIQNNHNQLTQTFLALGNNKSKKPTLAINSSLETCYEVETIRVKLKISEKARQVLSSPDLAVEIAKEIYKTLDVDQEHFVIMALNTQNEVVGFKVIASGMMDEVSIDMRIIFRTALLLGAANLIVAHNHPSGHVEPSEADRKLTKSVVEAGRLLQIRILDHLIISGEKYFSFLKMGLI